jgi:hypothetical protein
LAEASSLVCLDLRKSKFYPSKLDLWISGLVLLVFWYLWYSGTSGTSGTLVFWYFWYFVKLGFHFLGDLATEKVCTEGAKMILEGGHTFLDGFRDEIPHQQKGPNLHV